MTETINPRVADLLRKYDQHLAFLNCELCEVSTYGDKYEMLGHLRWMIKRMLSPDWGSDEIKTNRWLGYIQGVLSAHRVFSILDLRDQTRPLYNSELPLWE